MAEQYQLCTSIPGISTFSSHDGGTHPGRPLITAFSKSPLGTSSNPLDNLPRRSVPSSPSHTVAIRQYIKPPRTEPSSARNIRLLDVLPGLENEEIRCISRVVSLDENIGYEALSYVWGGSAQKIVVISGTNVAVARNLYTALRRLRHPTHKRTLWVDQLCINQWDNEEKAQQVAMMREIYKNCTHCMIWFGEFKNAAEGFSSRDVQAVFDFLEAMSAIEIEPMQEVPILFQESAEGATARQAFRAFAMNGNPWWSRIWTVQEALIPTSAKLQWGPLSVSWSDVQRTALHLCSDEHVYRISGAVDHAMLQHSGLLALFLYPVRGLQRSANGEAPLKLLMRWRYREATDPRDKIYALLGLLPPGAIPSARHCDYNIPLHILFKNATLDLLRDEGGLRPLLGASEMPHMTPGLPSWAIDFACSSHLGMRHAKWWRHSDRYSQFIACGEGRLRTTFPEERMVLYLVGVYVDKVLDVANVYKVAESQDISDDEFRKAIETCYTLLNHHHISLDLSYIGGGSFKEASWRTMIGDLITYERPIGRAKSHHEDDFNRFVQFGTHNVVYDALSGMLPNRAFFLTKKGYIGIGPPQTQIGDQVWIYNGGRVPFVMRREKDDSIRDERPRLSLIGDAYVHGIMSGEVVRDESETQTSWII